MTLALASLVFAAACSLEDARCEVRWIERDGEKLVSLRADEAALGDVVASLAENVGLAVERDELWSRALVSVELVERPWRRALEVVLASVGLRAEIRGDRLTLRDDVGAGDAPAQLYEAALASYLRVAREFPEHSLAQSAQLAQAQIETARGNLSAARAQCEALLERGAGATLAPHVLALAAELSMRERLWDRAASRWSELLRSEPELEVETRARRELARCWTMLGNHERALTMLDALETLAPARDAADRAARQAIRARALAGLGRGADALQLVDALGADSGAETLELRAIASEASARPSDAARAWLAFADGADVYASACAFDSAARLALEAGDALAVLFIERTARARGLEISAQTLYEARAQLALDSGTEQERRLDAAELALSTGAHDEAFAELLALLPARDQLDPATALRFDCAYADALAVVVSVDDALAHLRSVLPRVDGELARRRVYVVAGELCERAERFEDAAEAYRGRL